jgi:hypothetical protein
MDLNVKRSSTAFLSEQVQVSKTFGQITPYCFFANAKFVSKAPDGRDSPLLWRVT